jgi:hypothetical protein
MKNTSFLGFRFLRLVTVVCVLMGAGVFPVSAQTQLPQTAQDILNQLDTSPADDNYAVTAAYVAQFYPLWFTYNQSRFDNLLGTANTMVGPAQVSPIYHFVAAINYDTLYSSVYLNVSTEPVLITIPSTAETDVQYSVLLLDPYGTEFPSGIPPQTPGVYAYTGPDFTGTLPEANISRIQLAALPRFFPS